MSSDWRWIDQNNPPRIYNIRSGYDDVMLKLKRLTLYTMNIYKFISF